MNRAKTKDRILRFLLESENHSGSISLISSNFNEDFNKINYYCDQLIEESFVDPRSVSSASQVSVEQNRYDKILILTSKGIYFLTIDGGYRKWERNLAINRIWKYVKVIAAILNALAILYLGYYNIIIIKEQSKYQKIIEKQNRTIDSLQKAMIIRNRLENK